MDDELSDLREEVAELHVIIGDLAVVVQSMQQETLAEAKWWWPAMTQREARVNWDKLTAWVDSFSQWYGNPGNDGPRPPSWLVACWYRHPRALDGVTAFYVAHTEAYGKRGRGWDKAEWLTRWYRDLTEVVKDEAGRCDARMCEHDGTPNPGTAEARAAFATRLVAELPDRSPRPTMRVTDGDHGQPSPVTPIDLDA